jgi:hypothetical protein
VRPARGARQPAVKRGPRTRNRPRSFRHVLGIEAEAQMVLAAKELKAAGELDFSVAGPEGGEVRLTARVADDVDRDRVR